MITTFPLRRLVLGFAFAGLLAGAALPVAAGDAAMIRGKPTKDQILRALGAPADEPVSTRRTRGLSLGGAPAALPAAPAPEPAYQAPTSTAAAASRALDLEIPFEFNSANLTVDGREVLDVLAEALRSQELADVQVITLEGHTDAAGSDSYNRMLSLRRAQSVRSYLSSQHGVPRAMMRAVGKGESELADPSNPTDGINRRVRVIVEG